MVMLKYIPSEPLVSLGFLEPLVSKNKILDYRLKFKSSIIDITIKYGIIILLSKGDYNEKQNI